MQAIAAGRPRVQSPIGDRSGQLFDIVRNESNKNQSYRINHTGYI